ncbi:MAG: type II secretion system F family protein [Nocardioidaceae bacterium]|nr:type II secretion system F family protein [Nocardioidaceae bacterium]
MVTGAAAVLAAALGVWLDGVRLTLALVLAGAAMASSALWQRRRSERRSERLRESVVELSEALVGELRAGQPVVKALDRCRQVWGPFAPVVAAARLGADVPAALSALAEQTGAEGFERLGSAWRVSQRTGCSLAGVLDQVAVSARAERTAARLVRSELASAQATARLVALLPVVTLSMASGAGGNPWSFLLDQPAGLVCLATGASLVFLGLWWIDRIALAAARP